jgi:hypothetical protein
MFSNEQCTLSPEELDAVREKILAKVGRHVWMPPYSSLGPYVGTSHTTKLTDFVDSSSAILISRIALEKLREAGIELLTGPAHVRCRGKMLDSHLVLHVEPLPEPELAPATVEALTMKYCSRCGHSYKADPCAKVKPGQYQLRKDRVPMTATLFCLYEWAELLATEAFVDAASKLGLSGAKFRPWGTVV